MSPVTHKVRTRQCNLVLTGLEAALVDAGRALDAIGVAGLEAANSARLPGLLAGWAAKPVPSWPHRWAPAPVMWCRCFAMLFHLSFWQSQSDSICMLLRGKK